MKRFRAAGLVLLGIVAGSASAQAVPVANPIIIGAPTIAVTFAHTPPGFVVFNEYLMEPAATVATTGGGVGQADVFAPEGIAQPIPGPDLSAFGGIQIPFMLGLDGPGTVELTMSGKVRTTATTTTLQEGPPFAASFIDIGPNTQITGTAPGSIRFVLDWDLAIVLTQEGRQSETRRTARRVVCPNSVGIVCEQAYDVSVLDNHFMPRPGVPSIIETTMNYVVTLESRPVTVPEPASWPLMAVASLVIGFMAAPVRRRIWSDACATGPMLPLLEVVEKGILSAAERTLLRYPRPDRDRRRSPRSPCRNEARSAARRS